MRKHEPRPRQRDPEPADLDKIHIKHVPLLGEVRRRVGGGVGLRVREVGGATAGGGELGEEGAEEEGGGVDGEEEGFQARGEGWGVLGCGGGGAHGGVVGGGVVVRGGGGDGDLDTGCCAPGRHCWRGP